LTPAYHAAFYDFFGGTSSTIGCVDPRVIYWSWDDRFALVCSDIESTPNVLRFAVSATGDPTRAWHKYEIANSGFLDQPKLVASQDKLVVAGNGGNNTTQFYVYQKSDVVDGRPNLRVTHLTSSQNLYQAVVEYTATDDASFVFSYDAGHNISLATITGTPARKNVAMEETILGVSDVQYPLEPAIPGGTLGGGALDPRVNNAVYEVETSDRRPVIQYSQSAECNPGGLGATVCIATGRIDTSGSRPVLQYQTLLGAAGSAYTYGAVTLDGYGRFYATYSRSSSTTMPSAAVLGGGSPMSTFDTIVQPATAGTVCGNTSPCDERWGDYMGAAQDPTDHSKVWLAALYQAKSSEFGWGTIITRASSAGIG